MEKNMETIIMCRIGTTIRIQSFELTTCKIKRRYSRRGKYSSPGSKLLVRMSWGLNGTNPLLRTLEA